MAAAKDELKRPVLQKSLPGDAPASESRGDVKDDYFVVPSPAPLAPVLSGPSRLPGISADKLLAAYMEGGRGKISGKYKKWTSVTALAAISSAAANTAYLLGTVPQGTTSNFARLGTQIRMHSLTWRGEFFWAANTAKANGVAANQTVPIRLTIYVDKMPALGGSTFAENLVTPVSFASIFTTNAQGEGYNSVAPYNLNTHGTRYDILVDEIIRPRNQFAVTDGTTVWAGAAENREFHIPLHGKLCSYFNTAGTDLLENSLEYMIECDAIVAGQTLPNFQSMWTLNYEDVADS